MSAPLAARSVASSRPLVLERPRHDSGPPVLLQAGRYLLGSDPRCDVVCRSAGIQPEHAVLLCDGSRVTLQAIDPKTWVNDQLVREVVLRPGDRVSFGPATFQVRRATADELLERTEPVATTSETRSGRELRIDAAPAAPTVAPSTPEVAIAPETPVEPDRPPLLNTIAPNTLAVNAAAANPVLANLAPTAPSAPEQAAIRVAEEAAEASRRARARELEAQWEQRGREQERFETLLRASQATMQARLLELDERQRQLARQEAELLAARQQVDRLQCELAEQTELLRGRLDLADQRDADLLRREERLTFLSDELERRQGELEAAWRERQLLQQDVERRQAELTTNRQQVDRLEVDLQNRARDLEARLRQLERSEQEVDEWQQRLSQRERQLQAAEADCEATRAQLNLRDADQISQQEGLLREHAALTQGLAATRDDLERVRRENVSLWEIRNQLQTELEALTARLMEAIATASANAPDPLAQEREQIEREAQARELTVPLAELAARETELAARNAELAKRDAALAARDTDLAARDAELEQERHKLSSQAAQLEQLQSQLRAAEEALGLLRDEYAALSQRANVHQQALDEAAQQHAATSDQLLALRAELDSQAAAATQAQAELRWEVIHRDDLQSRNNSLTHQLVAIEEALLAQRQLGQRTDREREGLADLLELASEELATARQRERELQDQAEALRVASNAAAAPDDATVLLDESLREQPRAQRMTERLDQLDHLLRDLISTDGADSLQPVALPDEPSAGEPGATTAAADSVGELEAPTAAAARHDEDDERALALRAELSRMFDLPPEASLRGGRADEASVPETLESADDACCTADETPTLVTEPSAAEEPSESTDGLDPWESRLQSLMSLVGREVAASSNGPAETTASEATALPALPVPPVPPVPPPLPVTPPPLPAMAAAPRALDAVTPETAVAGGATAPEDDEESISSYMARLLNRNRGDTGPAAASSKSVPAPVSPPLLVQAPAQDATSQVQVPLADPHETPAPSRSQSIDREAVRQNMQSFREVANLSARSAVARHSWESTRGTILIKAVLTMFCAAGTMAFLGGPLFGGEVFLVQGSGCLLAFAYMASELFRAYRELRTHHDRLQSSMQHATALQLDGQSAESQATPAAADSNKSGSRFAVGRATSVPEPEWTIVSDGQEPPQT